MKKHLLAAAITVLAAGSAIAQANDTLAKIKSSGAITLGVRESSGALAYTLGDGKYVGFHTEMAERIARDLQKKLGLSKLEIKYQPVTSQNRIPLLINGTIDLECGSTTNNEARQKQVAFAPTTFVTNVRMAVKKNSHIASLTQLAGKAVATTTGTTSVQLLRAHEKARGVDFRELYGKDHADSFLLLETDRAVAFVMDDNLLAGLIASSKSPADYAIVGEVLSIEPIAIMLRRDDPEFKKLVDDTIRGLMASGEVERLYQRWFMSPIPPRQTSLNFPMSELLRELLKKPSDAPAEAYNRKS